MLNIKKYINKKLNLYLCKYFFKNFLKNINVSANDPIELNHYKQRKKEMVQIH